MGIALLVGCVLAAGLVAVVKSRVPVMPRLDDSLDVLDGRVTAGYEEAVGVPARVGTWAEHRLRIRTSEDLRRRLRLRNLTPSEFVFRKVVAAGCGLLAPLLVAATVFVITGTVLALAAPVALILGVALFFVPDLALRGEADSVASDATESLLTFFDLVTLERLANQSAAHALSNAAAVSDVPVFRWIHGALDRSRLEQRAPYQELRRLGGELGLPSLVDLAEVMRLDDTGASLSGTLRARVKELRDAHLTEAKVAASAVSERMTFFMVVPSLVFGLIFLVPPLLRLLAG